MAVAAAASAIGQERQAAAAREKRTDALRLVPGSDAIGTRGGALCSTVRVRTAGVIATRPRRTQQPAACPAAAQERAPLNGFSRCGGCSRGGRSSARSESWATKSKSEVRSQRVAFRIFSKGAALLAPLARPSLSHARHRACDAADGTARLLRAWGAAGGGGAASLGWGGAQKYQTPEAAISISPPPAARLRSVKTHQTQQMALYLPQICPSLTDARRAYYNFS